VCGLDVGGLYPFRQVDFSDEPGAAAERCDVCAAEAFIL
jgi:hypothetical protein